MSSEYCTLYLLYMALSAHGACVQALERSTKSPGELSLGVKASATEAPLFIGGTYLWGNTNLWRKTVVLLFEVLEKSVGQDIAST